MFFARFECGREWFSTDANAISLLSSFEVGEEAAVSYAERVIESGGLYELDRCWILLYQLF